MRVTTLFEHSSSHGFLWDDPFLAAVERLNRGLGAEVLRCTTRKGVREIQARQHVGVFRVGGRTIQVLPKICRDNTDVGQQHREATRNLLHCLAYARQLTVREASLAPLLGDNADWFEILTRLFASHLFEEWKRGPIRHYQPRDAELTRLRGKWRISDQLRHPERKHRFSVTYNEFTADNPLNRVFRFVVEALWRTTRDAGNRKLLGTLRDWMADVSLPAVVTIDDAPPSLITRLTQRFGPCLSLARLFLEGRSLNLHAGNEATYAFFFDMNQLFEAFIAGFLQRHRAEIFNNRLADCEILPQSAGAAFYLAKGGTGNRFLFRLKPDIALRRGAIGATRGAAAAEYPLLIDTKYKRLDTAKAALAVDQSDFYQMYAYARRYACPAVVLLYPFTAGMSGEPVRQTFTLQDSIGSGTVLVATVDLRRAINTRAGQKALAAELRAIFAVAQNNEQEKGCPTA